MTYLLSWAWTDSISNFYLLRVTLVGSWLAPIKIFLILLLLIMGSFGPVLFSLIKLRILFVSLSSSMGLRTIPCRLYFLMNFRWRSMLVIYRWLSGETLTFYGALMTKVMITSPGRWLMPLTTSLVPMLFVSCLGGELVIPGPIISQSLLDQCLTESSFVPGGIPCSLGPLFTPNALSVPIIPP